MKRVVIRTSTPIAPFGEPARELRVLNKPLWLLQRDLLARHCQSTIEIESGEELPESNEELLVHCDHHFFNAPLMDTFIAEARRSGRACQLAFALDDKAITTHALALQESIRKQDDVYVADVFYYPHGPQETPRPRRYGSSVRHRRGVGGERGGDSRSRDRGAGTHLANR